MALKPACTKCNTVHPSNLARAIGRFNPNGPLGYRAAMGGPAAPLRATRAEAEQDACQQQAPKRKAVTITAANMIYAQGATLDTESRATLVAKADRDRAEFGETALQPINVPVQDFHGALIGHMTYML